MSRVARWRCHRIVSNRRGVKDIGASGFILKSLNIGFSEAKASFRQKLARKWGHAIARGWATLLLDRLRDFVVVPSSAGGNSSFERHLSECDS